MYSKVTQRRASKGSVQIKDSNGRLQLVFSHAGKRHYLSLGLADNRINRKVAEAKAKSIEYNLWPPRPNPDKIQATISAKYRYPNYPNFYAKTRRAMGEVHWVQAAPVQS